MLFTLFLINSMQLLIMTPPTHTIYNVGLHGTVYKVTTTTHLTRCRFVRLFNRGKKVFDIPSNNFISIHSQVAITRVEGRYNFTSRYVLDI